MTPIQNHRPKAQGTSKGTLTAKAYNSTPFLPKPLRHIGFAQDGEHGWEHCYDCVCSLLPLPVYIYMLTASVFLLPSPFSSYSPPQRNVNPNANGSLLHSPPRPSRSSRTAWQSSGTKQSMGLLSSTLQIWIGASLLSLSHSSGSASTTFPFHGVPPHRLNPREPGKQRDKRQKSYDCFVGPQAL